MHYITIQGNAISDNARQLNTITTMAMQFNIRQGKTKQDTTIQDNTI